MARTEGVWIKDGDLISPSEDVPILLVNDYLNFGGLLVGSDGFGIRNNAGAMEVKDSSGSWLPIGTGAASDSPEFEKTSKNLASYPYTLTYTGENLTSIAYTTPTPGTITKTLNYTGDVLTSITET